MGRSEQPAARCDRLQAEIAAARARLADEAPDIGDLMDGLSHEINDVTGLYEGDPEKAHARLDGIEARLGEACARIDQAGRAG